MAGKVGSKDYNAGGNYQNEMFNRSKDLKVQDGKNKLELKGIDNGNAYI